MSNTNTRLTVNTESLFGLRRPKKTEPNLEVTEVRGLYNLCSWWSGWVVKFAGVDLTVRAHTMSLHIQLLACAVPYRYRNSETYRGRVTQLSTCIVNSTTVS